MTTPRLDYIRSLPPPNVVESTDYQANVDAIIATVQQQIPEWTAGRDDPLRAAIEALAYTITIQNNRWNERFLQSLWAYATGENLDHLALNIGVQRTLGETDDQLRERGRRDNRGRNISALVGLQAISYQAGIVTLFDVQAIISTNGQVITVYGIDALGADIGVTNRNTLQTFLRRPENLTIGKAVNVSAATAQAYTITANISYNANITDVTDLEARVRESIYNYIDSERLLNNTIYTSAVSDALFVPGVENVTLTAPAADVAKANGTVPICPKDTTNVVLTFTNVA